MGQSEQLLSGDVVAGEWGRVSVPLQSDCQGQAEGCLSFLKMGVKEHPSGKALES